ncbi:hypothetical protein AB685_14820 [Bacillus sp. LL01]|uniref:hypothetical protein n=1 Tax=Bacillus sp. LL01 TaxID=1665556 RepID=UPI00064D1709|nr:hypothetical protein [Bacillus sp. LL01]KMJ58077.1 hypothetical protein AB685_14820 [Bacillus sp. LL01]
MANGINVPIGPAVVEYGDGAEKVTFDITKGGIQFQSSTSKQDITVDQYGDTVVKSIMKGRTAQVTVPFALHDLARLSEVIPNSDYVNDGVKSKIVVKSQAGFDMLSNAKMLIIKPTDPNATANDWITLPLAGAMADPEYTYDSDNERVVNITFVAYPDLANDGTLYIIGDETAIDA